MRARRTHRRLARILAAAAVLAAGVVLGATAAPASAVTDLLNTTGSLATGDSTQTGRLGRNAIVAGCQGAKTNPGINPPGTGARRYDSYTLTNTAGSSKCFTVALGPGATSPCNGNVYFSATYLSSFNPADPAANYLADAGASLNEQVYSFIVAAGATVVVVVHDVNEGAFDCNYTLKVTSADPAVARSAAGAGPANIQAAVDQFRTDLGTLNSNVVGSFQTGRREINWDEVPDDKAAPNNLPADFFNTTSPRGVVFSTGTGGTGFQVSAKAGNPSGTPTEFGNIHSGYPAAFQPFSPERLFTPLGSNETNVDFFVPGTATPSFTTGFGAVFADVDNGVTSIRLLNQANQYLGVYVPAAASNGLSFIGASLSSDPIGKVRLLTNIQPTAAGTDAEVFDDFIYGEPPGSPAAGSPTQTGTGAASGTGSGGATVGPGGAQKAAFSGPDAKLSLAGKSITLSAKGTAALPLLNGNPFTVDGKLSLAASAGVPSAARKRKRKRKTIKLGSSSFKLPASRKTAVKVKISRRGRALVRRARRLRTKVTIVARDPSGNSRTVKASVVIKRAKRARKRRRY